MPEHVEQIAHFEVMIDGKWVAWQKPYVRMRNHGQFDGKELLRLKPHTRVRVEDVHATVNVPA